MTWTEIIDNILGVYNPIRNIDGSIVGGFGGLDLPYIIKAIILIIAFYMFFSIMNSFIKAIRR